MIRSIALALCLILATASIGCSGPAPIDLGRVIVSGRDGWQYPERVVAALEIRPGDGVAEIGAGSGYWLSWPSEAVDPSGRVYAVEFEEELVRKLEARVAKLGLTHVEVVSGDYDDPMLPGAGVDLAITCLAYHHIEERVVYFRRLTSDLGPTGRVAHLDFLVRGLLAPPGAP